MTAIVHGQSVTWATWDRERTVSAGLQWMLRDVWRQQQVRLEVIHAVTAEEVAEILESQRLGLLSFVISADDLPNACRMLVRCRLRQPACLRLVYVAECDATTEAALSEAGAQIVVKQIPCLQRLVPLVATRVPKVSGGFHPLTSGLVDRLPWGDR